MWSRATYRLRFWWHGMRIWWRDRGKPKTGLRWQFEAAYYANPSKDRLQDALESIDYGESLAPRLFAYWENPPTVTYRERTDDDGPH